MAEQKMHQTTLRFGADLWRALEEECAELGVSVAQFVRESALARLMYLAGRRGDLDYERALDLSGANLPPGDPDLSHLQEGALDRRLSEAWAQGRQAQHRPDELREVSTRRRDTR